MIFSAGFQHIMAWFHVIVIIESTEDTDIQKKKKTQTVF